MTGFTAESILNLDILSGVAHRITQEVGRPCALSLRYVGFIDAVALPAALPAAQGGGGLLDAY